jgi:hypothetical protein
VLPIHSSDLNVLTDRQPSPRGFYHFLNPSTVSHLPPPPSLLDIFIETTTKQKQKRLWREELGRFLFVTYPVSLVVYREGCSFST